MKTLITAATLAAAVALPAPAFAIHIYDGMQFGNRGECESFLKRERNEARIDNARSPDDFNSFVRDRFFCEANGDGTFTFRDRSAT